MSHFKIPGCDYLFLVVRIKSNPFKFNLSTTVAYLTTILKLNDDTRKNIQQIVLHFLNESTLFKVHWPNIHRNLPQKGHYESINKVPKPERKTSRHGGPVLSGSLLWLYWKQFSKWWVVTARKGRKFLAVGKVTFVVHSFHRGRLFIFIYSGLSGSFK